MTLDECTGYVRQHLHNHGFRERYGLDIETVPGGNGRLVTTVRAAADRSKGWTAGYAAQLAAALGSLPRSDVRLRPVVDKIVVVWRDGD